MTHHGDAERSPTRRPGGGRPPTTGCERARSVVGRRRPVRGLFVVAAAGIVAVAGVGCSSSATSTATADTGRSAATIAGPAGATAGSTPGSAPVGASTSTWHTELTSKSKQLHTVGADEQITYGWNQLAGTSTIDGRPAEIELLGSVDYVKGSGPWSGFFTITTSDGTLGLRATGKATLDAATKNTAFTGDLQVIGGTGRFVAAAGTATAVGTRVDALGGQVNFDVTMTLTGVPT